jgi:nicotinamide mononucleotide transporter
MNIYYLLAAAYGYIGWKYGFGKKKLKEGEEEELPITHTPFKQYLPLTLIFLVLWWGIYFILISVTDSNVPIIDSFINALSIIAMWMLAKKYVEQWMVWILIDALSSALYIYKDLKFTSILYAVYAIVAIFGYRKWQKMVIQDKQENE